VLREGAERRERGGRQGSGRHAIGGTTVPGEGTRRASERNDTPECEKEDHPQHRREGEEWAGEGLEQRGLGRALDNDVERLSVQRTCHSSRLGRVNVWSLHCHSQ
jgi:hypothetical protein